MVHVIMENHSGRKPVGKGQWVVSERTQSGSLEFTHDRLHVDGSEQWLMQHGGTELCIFHWTLLRTTVILICIPG